MAPQTGLCPITSRRNFTFRAPGWPNELFSELRIVEAMEPNGDDCSVFNLGTPLYSGYTLILGISNCYLSYDRPGSTGARESVITIGLNLPNLLVAKTVNPMWTMVRFFAEKAMHGH